MDISTRGSGAGANPEVRLLKAVGVASQLGGRSAKDDRAPVENGRFVGHLEGQADVLLDQHHGAAALGGSGLRPRR